MAKRNCLVQLLYWLSNEKEWWPESLFCWFCRFFVIVLFVRSVMRSWGQAGVMILLMIVLPWLLGLEYSKPVASSTPGNLGSPMKTPLWLNAAYQLRRRRALKCTRVSTAKQNPIVVSPLWLGHPFFFKWELLFRFLCFDPKQSNFTVKQICCPTVSPYKNRFV